MTAGRTATIDARRYMRAKSLVWRELFNAAAMLRRRLIKQANKEGVLVSVSEHTGDVFIEGIVRPANRVGSR